MRTQELDLTGLEDDPNFWTWEVDENGYDVDTAPVVIKDLTKPQGFQLFSSNCQ